MWTASFIPGYLWDNGSKNIKKLAQLENKIEVQNRFMEKLNLAVDTYVWEDLPSTCDSRFLELMLALNGWASMKKTKEGGLLTLGFLPSKWSLYGQPTNGMSFGFFGQAMQSVCYVGDEITEGVDTAVCRCNTLNYPIINYIRITASRLADIQRSMDVIRKQIKSPFIVNCSETQVPTAEKIFNKTQENEIYIIGSNMLDRDAFQVVQTGVNGQNIEILQQHYDNVNNGFNRLIGIKGSTNTDKKERLIVPEATSDYAITNDYLDQGLHTRMKFAEDCNFLFGTNIKVKVNDSREYFTEADLYPNMQGSEENTDEIL